MFRLLVFWILCFKTTPTSTKTYRHGGINLATWRFHRTCLTELAYSTKTFVLGDLAFQWQREGVFLCFWAPSAKQNHRRTLHRKVHTATSAESSDSGHEPAATGALNFYWFHSWYRGCCLSPWAFKLCGRFGLRKIRFRALRDRPMALSRHIQYHVVCLLVLIEIYVIFNLKTKGKHHLSIRRIVHGGFTAYSRIYFVCDSWT